MVHATPSGNALKELLLFSRWISLQVSYFIESGEELVSPGVSGISERTDLYLTKREVMK